MFPVWNTYLINFVLCCLLQLTAKAVFEEDSLSFINGSVVSSTEWKGARCKNIVLRKL